MKRNLYQLVAFAAALSLSQSALEATPYTLASVPKSTLGGLGDADVGNWLLGLVNAYNGTHDPDLPTVAIDSTPDVSVNFSNGPKSFALNVSDYDYLVIHWGGQRGGVVQAFYLGGEPDGAVQTFNSPANGISFYRYYGPDKPHNVPDSGTAFALLGAAMVGIGSVVRTTRRVAV